MKRTLLIFALLCASPLLAQQQIPITGGVVTADLSSGVTSFKVNLNQNVTSVVLTGQHPGSGGNTVICTLFFVQDATGGWTVTFGGNITGGFAVNATPLFTTVEQFAFDFTSNTWYVINAGSAGASGISGGGTLNDIAMFTGPFSIGNAPIVVAGGVTSSLSPFSQPASLFNCTNSASGTTNGLLVTRDASGNCINLPAAQTTKIVGVVYTGGGTSGVSLVCKIGTCPIILDNTSVIDDCIIAATSGSQGHDAGPTCPTGVQQLGIAQNVNAGTGTPANVDVFISDIQSGPSGPVQTLQVNGVTLAGTLDNFNSTTPAAPTNFQNLPVATDNGTPTSNVVTQAPQATTGQAGLIKLAQDLCNTFLLPDVCGIQGIPVTFNSIAVNDVICFPTISTLGNCHPGVPIRTFSGATDTMLTTDRTGWVRPTTSGTVAETLPQAGSAGFTSNYVFGTLNNATGIDTITPTTSTINGASTLAVYTGWFALTTSDNTNYFSALMPTAAGFPACPDTTGNHLNFTTAAGISCGTSGGGGGGGGTLTSVSGSSPIVATPNPIVATGSVSCPSCAVGSSFTNTSLVAGTGGQGIAVITTPSQCSAGQAATGITATGAANGCFTPGSGVTSVTASGFLASSGGATPNITVAHSQGTDTNLLTAGTVAGTGALLCTDANAGATTSTCGATASQIPSSIRTRGLVFSYGDPGNSSAITAGATATDYITVPFACTISAYNLLIDGGTITVKFWKVATGTAIPTVSNSISTSGVGISSGTAIHSTTVTDFTTTTVSANDIMAMNVSAAATAKFVSGTLECDQ